MAYLGNIVDLLEYVYDNNIHVDLLSDQTSCHVPYDGGYCPQGLTFEERTKMLEPLRTISLNFRAMFMRPMASWYRMRHWVPTTSLFFLASRQGRCRTPPLFGKE